MGLLNAPRAGLPLLLGACVWIGEGRHRTELDADGDGRSVFEECDDADPQRLEGPVERFVDVDGDGVGGAERVFSCPAPGLVDVTGDCDDLDPAVHPGALERCDVLEVDEDCDGGADDDDPEGASGRRPIYLDDDGDGYGDLELGLACHPAPGESLVDGDCDDAEPLAHPGALERCDGEIDEDCDGDTDEPGALGELAWFLDGDGDGHGDPNRWEMGCEAAPFTVALADDCDDVASWIFPGAPERCDAAGFDEDCDGGANVDDPDGRLAHPDADGDGWGAAGSEGVAGCPLGWVQDASDCDDADPAVFPGQGCTP